MSRAAGADLRLSAVALGAGAGLAAALVSQHVFGTQPCPWCVLQRLIFVLLGLAALLGLAWRSGLGARVGAALAAAMAVWGVGTALWHHFVAASSASCNLTFADRFIGATGLDSLWPQVFAAYASCADGAAHLLGLPYELWSLGLYAVLGLIAASAWRRRG
ncbi:MAG: disulfide bond formation protein B [Burkholderiales bacterium]|nr:disulfide bond formation protein B [Burkholderiales bacterium]